MKKFRIKVDLSVFFDDERKLAHILVDPAWESVKSLQKRVEQIFELENVRFITNEGCFVPPQEPIQVIKTGDVLRAFIPAGDMKKKKKKVKSQHEVAVNDEEKVKKRKREIVTKETGFTSSTPNHAKRSKSVLPLTVAIKNNTVDEITSTSEQLGLKFEKQKQKNNLCPNAEELQTSSVEKEASCQKMSTVLLPERSDKIPKKRGRKKKNKINQSLIKNNEPMDQCEKSNLGSDDAAPAKQTTSKKLILSAVSATTLQNESQQKLSSQLGHTYFNDAGETVSTTTENGTNEIPVKVIFRCPVSEVSYDKPRVFSLKKMNSDTPETTNDHTTLAIKEKQSDVVPEPKRIKSKSPVIIEELVIIPSVLSTVDKSLNKESSNANETDVNQADTNMETTAEQTEQDATIAADDSSVIAIESEYDDDDDCSEEENDKNESNEQEGDVSEIIDLNASDDESQQSTIIVSAGDQPAEVPGLKMSIAEMLPFTTVLEALPIPNEIIIFKLHCLNGKMSGNISGKCEYINKRTKTIKVMVIDGQKEISKIPNKYICALDDSSVTDKQYLQIKYNDLLDAKLFSVN